MSFQKIDDSYVVADKPLSAALLQDIQGNARAAREERLPACAWTVDYRNHPRLCAYERHALPYIVKLPSGTNEIKIRVRCSPGAGGVTLGAVIVPITWVDRPLPADMDTQSIVSGGESTYTLTLDSDDINGLTGWCIIALTVFSVEGTAVEIEDSGTAATDGHLEATKTTFLKFGGPSTSFGDEIPCAAVEVRRYTSGNPSSSATWIPELLSRRQVVRAEDTGATSKLWFYPPVGVDQAALSTGSGYSVIDVAWWIPLGYLDLFSVEIRVSGIGALPSAGTSLNARQRAMGSQGRRLYAESHHVFTHHGRWHHIGPQSDPDNTDTSDPAKGWWGATTTPPVSPLHSIVQLDGSGYEDLGVCVVNRDTEYQDVDGSTNKRRSAIDALMLVCVQGYDDPLQFEMETRLSFDTMATLAGAVNGESESIIVGSSIFDRTFPPADMAGYILGLSELTTGDGAYTNTLVLHSLRGLYDAGRWGDYQWAVLRARAKDTNISATGRYCHFELNQVDKDVNDEHPSATSPSRFVHIATWTAVTAEGGDGTAIGVS